MTATYTTLLKSPNGTTIAELPDATGIKHSWYLNQAGAASFNLPKRTPSIAKDFITLGYTTMHTYRNGTLMWAGEIQTKSGALQEGVVSYGAKDWFQLFDGVLVFDQSYEGKDPTFIIRDLVENYLLTLPRDHYDFGVRMGLEETTQLRDRTFENEDMKRCIEGLTDSRIENGVDIEVTADKLLNVFARKGTLLDSVTFELGRNIIDYWITEDASSLSTDVLILGAGDGSSMLTARDESSVETLSNFRRRTTTLARKDITIYDTLHSHAVRERQQRQVPRQIVTIHVDANLDPGWGAYSVGDTVRINIDEGLNQVDGWFRIYGLELHRSPLGKEIAKIITNPL